MSDPEQGQEASTKGRPVRGGPEWHQEGISLDGGTGGGWQGGEPPCGVPSSQQGEEASAQRGGGGRGGSPVSQMLINQVTGSQISSWAKGVTSTARAGIRTHPVELLKQCPQTLYREQ